MPTTLSKSQKFILEQLNATFESGFVRNNKCEKCKKLRRNDVCEDINEPVHAGQFHVRIIDKDSGALLAKAVHVDEQDAVNKAIEIARNGTDIPDHEITEKEQLELRLARNEKELRELKEKLAQDPQEPVAAAPVRGRKKKAEPAPAQSEEPHGAASDEE